MADTEHDHIYELAEDVGSDLIFLSGGMGGPKAFQGYLAEVVEQLDKILPSVHDCHLFVKELIKKLREEID